MLVLGIETTCDETAAAVIERTDDGSGRILSNIVRSQTGNTLVPFATILVLYFVFAMMIAFAIRALERRMARGLDGVRV